jgi:tetratricopeptide (TPR) repeat protein/predicted aspartyl protease
MQVRFFVVAVMILGLAVPPGPALAGCKLATIADLPVTMADLRPVVTAKINGTDALFIVDSGAAYSMITPAAAAEFRLKLTPPPANLQLRGIGGEVRTSITTVKEFTLANRAIPRVEFIVGGSEPGSGAAGLLGQNVLRLADVEYDLANGAIRLMRAEDCRKTVLAYWATGKPYSVVDIELATPISPHTVSTAFINGTKIRVAFDTGAETSFVSLRAAERAGVKTDGAGVVADGLSRGIGRNAVSTWIAPFASFKIGDEEVHNTRLRIGDVRGLETDMLIGSDFFLSHRVYVASSQGKLYFTYNGGPVFDLTSHPLAATASGGAAHEVAAEDKHEPKGAGDQPTDAEGLGRRGTAFTARRDFEHAIADLTRACELAPTEPKYFYELGRAHWSNQQLSLATADFDQALRLKPDDVPALMARAELRLDNGDNSAALTDLNAVDRAASKEADPRLLLSELYQRVDMLAPAIAQLDLWIAAHGADARMFDGRHARCWLRALLGTQLDKALADCNAALRLRPNTAEVLDSRGLVRLRLGQYEQSIADYNASLSLHPKSAWSLYGRGLAKLHKGLAAEAQADIAAATALDPTIADEFRKRGLGGTAE